jgi:hypothetical protein
MASNTVTNWFGNIVSHPSVIVDAKSVEDIVEASAMKINAGDAKGVV